MTIPVHFAALIEVAILLGAFFFARRFGGGAALENLERANRVLTKRVRELEESDARKGAEIASLRSRTDVTIAILPVLESMKMHEARAGERHVATLNVLDLIATRLGPDAEMAA
jgi:hypothetical protein